MHDLSALIRNVDDVLFTQATTTPGVGKTALSSTLVLPAVPATVVVGAPGAASVTVNVTSTELVEYVLVGAAVARTTQVPAAVKVSTLVEETMVQPVAPAPITAYEIAPLPEEAAANGVFGDCAVVSAVIGCHVTVWVDNVGVLVGAFGAASVTVNVTSTELVEYVLVGAAVARTTQVPAAVKVSTLVEETMVQPVAPAPITAYEIAPLPEEAAANGVFGDCAVVSAVIGCHVTVWVDNVGVLVGAFGAASVTVNVTSTELVEYVLVGAAVARTTQVPAAVKVSTLVEETMVQPVAPAPITAYEIAPLPEEDAANGVFGDCAVVSAVIGCHVTVWVDNETIDVTSTELVEYALVGAAVALEVRPPTVEPITNTAAILA